MDYLDYPYKKWLRVGVLSGILWGLIAMIVNRFTSVFIWEEGFHEDLLTFSMAGAFFGVVVTILFSLFLQRLPFKSYLLKAVMVSTGVWFIIWGGAIILHFIKPERYHPNLLQSVQGFFLAIILGLIIGWFYQHKKDKGVE